MTLGGKGMTGQRSQAHDDRSDCCASPTQYHWLEPVPGLWLPAKAHLGKAGPALGRPKGPPGGRLPTRLTCCRQEQAARSLVGCTEWVG